MRWALLFVPLLAASVLAARGVLPTPQGLFLSWWWAFAAGVAAFRLTRDEQGMPVVLASFVACLVVGTEKGIVAAASLAAIVVAIRREALGRWVAGPIWQWLGRISYSLYLTHYLTAWRLTNLLERAHLPWVLTRVAALAFAIACAHAFWWAVERPALALSRRLR